MAKQPAWKPVHGSRGMAGFLYCGRDVPRLNGESNRVVDLWAGRPYGSGESGPFYVYRRHGRKRVELFFWIHSSVPTSTAPEFQLALDRYHALIGAKHIALNKLRAAFLQPGAPAPTTPTPASNPQATMQWGFDLTDFGALRWRKLKRALGITAAPELTETGWHWRTSDGASIYTGNNPDSGEYYRPQYRAPEPGYASYMGVEGPADAVTRAVTAIKQHADSIKGESVGDREFI